MKPTTPYGTALGVNRTDQMILIVDDEPALMEALVDKFTRAGFMVMVAEDGQKGLTSALNNHPDLILLDIVMPVMDGLTVLAKLRKNSWGKHAKVILLTNLSETGTIDKTLIQTVSGYLIKSDWKIEDVVKQVNIILNEKNGKNIDC